MSIRPICKNGAGPPVCSDRIGVHREDLPVAVEQKVAADRAARILHPLRRGPEPDAVEKGRALQHVRGFERIEREVFGAALQRDVAPGAQKPRHREQVGEVLLVTPAVIFGLELGVDVGPHHQQPGAARLGHGSPLLVRSLCACDI